MDYKPQEIECPVCKNTIYFDVHKLLQGESFTCSNCKSTISLSSSSTQIVEQAMVKYERLKIQQNINTKK